MTEFMATNGSDIFPFSAEAAAWAQAVGSFLALGVAVWLSGASVRQQGRAARDKRKRLHAVGEGVAEEVQIVMASLLKLAEEDPYGDWDLLRARLLGLARSILQITASNDFDAWRYWDTSIHLNGLAEFLIFVASNPANDDRINQSAEARAKLDTDLRAASAFCDEILTSLQTVKRRGRR